MAPSPNNTPLCANQSSQAAMVLWKNDASRAVPGLDEQDAAAESISQDNNDEDRKITPTSSRCKCSGFPLKMVSLFKLLWSDPKYFRWVMTIVIAMFFAICVGFFNSFGPLYLCLRRDLHSTAVETGSVASLGWSIGVMSPFVNVLYQNVGPRKVCLVGTMLCSVGLLVTSFVHSIWPMFITFGLVFGVGVNFVITGSMSLIASHFKSNECALPTALPGIGGAVGMLIYSPVIELAYDRFGWRASIRFIALLMLASGSVCAVWQKRPASQKRRASHIHDSPPLERVTPTDVADGCSISRDKEKGAIAEDDVEATVMSSTVQREEKLQLLKERRQKTKENYKYLAKDPTHWMFCLATTLSNIVLVFNIISLLD